MHSTQLRLFNAFKRSGFNEDDAMDVSSIVEKVSDVTDIRKDVSDIKAELANFKASTKTVFAYLKAIGLVAFGLLIIIAFFNNY